LSINHNDINLKNYASLFFKIKNPQRIANITVIAKKPGTGVGVRGTGVASVAGVDGVGEYVWGTSVGVGVGGGGGGVFVLLRCVC